jgi:hypothetical protein
VVSKRTRWGVAAFAAVSLAAVSTPSAATVMIATFTGSVFSGGDGTGFFGLGQNADLAGEGFTAIFRYDTSLGIATTSPVYDGRLGGPQNGTVSPIVFASLEINGVTDMLEVFGNGSANVHRGFDTWEQTYAYTDSFAMNGAGDQIISVLELFVLSSPTPLALTTPYVGGNLVFNEGPLRTPQVNHQVFDHAAGYSVNYNAIFSPVQVVLAPYVAVPEPATWATLITGFMAVGAMLRRRRQVAA